VELPQDGERGLAIGGPKADAYFRGLAKKVDKAPQDAGFQVGSGGTISVEQSVDGRTLDVGGTARNVLKAALRRTTPGGPDRRVAPAVATRRGAERATQEAPRRGDKGGRSSHHTSFRRHATHLPHHQTLPPPLEQPHVS